MNQLIQIVDAAMAEAVRKSGSWIACRIGCVECCIGVFPISQSDAARLRGGLGRLDPQRAAEIRGRARDAAARLSPKYPGDAVTGILAEDPDSQERFETFADDEPCPVLDPATGACTLYESRPITCRTFGPAIRVNSDSVDVCELCYVGATDAQIEACSIDLDIESLEAEAHAGLEGPTIIAFALR